MLKSSIGAVMLYLALTPQLALSANGEMSRSPVNPKLAPRDNDQDACGLDAARRYIGSASDTSIRAAVAQSIGHSRIRWIRPGEAVTQDYRSDRLNVILDAAGRVLTMRCG